MAEAVFEILGIPKTRKELKKRLRNYREGMQDVLAFWLDLIRRQAANSFIIKNTTGEVNPRRARALQKTHPTKLTHRTGKMRHLLLQDSNAKSGGWATKGHILFKKQTSAFKMQIRTIRAKKADIGFLATIRVFITAVPAQVASVGGGSRSMPRESKKTIRARFMWELGIGGVKRPYFAPAAQRSMSKITVLLKKELNKKITGRGPL